MCQSKNDGGRRCPPTPTSRALRKIRRQGNRVAEQQVLAAREVYGPIVVPGEITVPDEISKMLDDLSAIGNPLIVGGSVRDAITDVVPKDFDIEVYGTSLDEIEAHLKAQGYRVDAVGKAFGVLKAQRGRNEEPIDISVPRRDSLNEGESGHRAFTVEQDGDLDVTEASARRDFTMNAIMYDHARKVFIDPHGGIDDLKAKRLRHVSEAFGEDPLRPLRAFQFAGRYGLTIDPETVEVCKSLRSRFSEIPKERVATEWEKFYDKVQSPSAALTVLREIGWDDTVPGLTTVDSAAADYASKAGPVFLGAVMARNMSDAEAQAFTKATIIGDKDSMRSYTLSRATPPVALDRNSLRKWARQIGKKELHISDWAKREAAFGPDADPRMAEVVSAAQAQGLLDSRPVDFLGGKDVLPLTSRTPGKWMGDLLALASEAQDQGEFVTPDQAMEWLRKRPELAS